MAPCSGSDSGGGGIDQGGKDGSGALVSRRGAEGFRSRRYLPADMASAFLRSLRIRLRELLSSQSGGASSKSARAISRALLPARSRSSAQIRKADSKVLAEGFSSLTGAAGELRGFWAKRQKASVAVRRSGCQGSKLGKGISALPCGGSPESPKMRWCSMPRAGATIR